MKALLISLIVISGAAPVFALDFETEARLAMAYQIAREHNDAALVKGVEQAATSMKKESDTAEIEKLLRKVEQSVGIDPGGWSMAGQALFHPSPERSAGTEAVRPKVEAAFESASVEGVRKAVAELLIVLGDQAGLPDGRRPGAHPGSFTLDEAGATRLFLDALHSEARAVRELSAGRAFPDQMLRFYAYMLEAVVAARPSVARHAPEDLESLDALAQGVATILLSLQQPEGHFPFPDLRGRNIRFGEMIDKQVAAGAIEVRDDWVITADPMGGSQFDTGLCGVALLRAGATYGEADWMAAGYRAADWALVQACVVNFNYNAFSVSLLAQAYQESRNEKYLEAALGKFRLGVAPGQAPNGRWIDSHNARTVYHIIILRAMGDLLEALPPERLAEITEVKAVLAPALTALLSEFATMGITVECLAELQTLAHHCDDGNLHLALRQVAASLVEKCTDGVRVKMGAQPHQLASVVAWCREQGEGFPKVKE